MQLLKVGLGCWDAKVIARWDIKEALARIEELQEQDPDLCRRGPAMGNRCFSLKMGMTTLVQCSFTK